MKIAHVEVLDLCYQRWALSHRRMLMFTVLLVMKATPSKNPSVESHLSIGTSRIQLLFWNNDYQRRNRKCNCKGSLQALTRTRRQPLMLVVSTTFSDLTQTNVAPYKLDCLKSSNTSGRHLSVRVTIYLDRGNTFSSFMPTKRLCWNWNRFNCDNDFSLSHT